jgi:phosphotransferase system  glucose/maltose/N-acetylglucosamine-specific IIC component
MTRKLAFTTAGVLGAAIAVYATARPYQQDRILIELGLTQR